MIDTFAHPQTEIIRVKIEVTLEDDEIVKDVLEVKVPAGTDFDIVARNAANELRFMTWEKKSDSEGKYYYEPKMFKSVVIEPQKAGITL